MTTRSSRWLIEGGALTLAALAFYLAIAPGTIVDGDNAELAAVGAIGGRPHPSGYPIYVLYLRATSWLPAGSPAHTAAIATVLLSTALVYVLYRACRAWGARRISALLATALYAASPVVLRMHTEAEVFALNGLVASFVLWLSATDGPLRGVARVAALGLVAGIGLGNHLTCVLVAPVGLLGAIRGVREIASMQRRALAVVLALFGLLLGLASYGYLFVADGPISFGRVEALRDALDFFTRKDYGGAGAFVPTDHTVPPLDNMRALAETLGRAYLYAPALAGVVMLGCFCARPRGESRGAWITLAGSWLVAGPLLALRFNVDPVGLGLYVCQRFHLLPLLLLAIPVALALDRTGDWLAPHATRLARPAISTTLTIMFFIGLAAASLPWLRSVHSPALERGVANILRSLPPNAIVIANSEDLCFGADYLEYAVGTRPDIDLACWIVTSREWYRDRLERRGVPAIGAYSVEITPAQAEAILETGRPLFVDRGQQQVLAAFPNYPYGGVIHVLPRGSQPPSVDEVFELNKKLFAEFDLDYPAPNRGDDWAAVMHRRYAKTWVTLATALERAGNKEAAEQAWELARQLQPARE